MKNYPALLFELLKNCFIKGNSNKPDSLDILYSYLYYDLTMYIINKKYNHPYTPWIFENYKNDDKDVSISVKNIIESLWTDFLKENKCNLMREVFVYNIKKKIYEIFK